MSEYNASITDNLIIIIDVISIKVKYQYTFNEFIGDNIKIIKVVYVLI